MTPEAFKALLDNQSDAVLLVDAFGAARYANPAALTILGARGVTVPVGSLLDAVHPDDRAGVLAVAYAVRDTPGPAPACEFRVDGHDSQWLPVEARAVNLITDPQVSGVLVTMRPVAERAALTRALRTLGEGNLVLVAARDEDELLQRMCETLTDTGGYLLAWAGIKSHDTGRRVLPVASAGRVGYLADSDISWGEGPAGKGPTGRAIREGLIQVTDDFRVDASFSPWRDKALQLGIRTSAVFPLRSHGEVIGALNIYAGEVGAFGPEAVALLEKLASAVSYGIERLRDGKRLGRSLDATLEALATLTEKRDPYTAGHMCRVGALTSAIGECLGIPADEARGLRIAADLHDVGKVVVPVEILTRPSRLSTEEFALVKLHSRAGHDVLAGIDFPWPVASLVVQHHERLDGSGYPLGLHGDQILFGARILAVADTVEAMTNHRPYRAGLGLQQALETVSAGAGTLYDTDVVTATIGMFEAGGFRFLEDSEQRWLLETPARQGS